MPAAGIRSEMGIMAEPTITKVTMEAGPYPAATLPLTAALLPAPALLLVAPLQFGAASGGTVLAAAATAGKTASARSAPIASAATAAEHPWGSGASRSLSGQASGGNGHKAPSGHGHGLLRGSSGSALCGDARECRRRRHRKRSPPTVTVLPSGCSDVISLPELSVTAFVSVPKLRAMMTCGKAYPS